MRLPLDMKRSSKLSTLLFASVALGAIAFAAQQTYSLARTTKVGEETEYKFSATLDFTEFKIDVSGKTREKITKVTEDGTVSYDTTQFGLVVKTPDGEQVIDEETTTKMTIGADRVVTKYGDEGDEDASSVRLSLLGTVKRPDKPIEIGSKWSAEMKNANKETYPVKADYEAIALEKVGQWDTLKVKISTKETAGDDPASAEGFIWIILADGSSAKEEMKIKKAPFPMSPTPIDMDVKVERTK